MALEQPTIMIDRILVVPILTSNLQFSTKVPKFGIFSQLQLPGHLALLASFKKKIVEFLIKQLWFGLAAHAQH